MFTINLVSATSSFKLNTVRAITVVTRVFLVGTVVHTWIECSVARCSG